MAGDFDERTGQLVYQFGDFRLLPERQALLFKGEAIALGGRAFDILTLLASRAGEVVSKAALFEHVWPGYIVHDHNLKVNVGNLRRSLAELDPEREYIATIPGRGYKFVAPLETDGLHGTRAEPPPAGPHTGPPDIPRLFGRDEAIRTICEQARQPGYLSIIGPGGVGKTAISIAAAQMCREEGQAVAFVDLSTVGDPRFIVPAVASAIGVSLALDDPIAEVIDRLRREPMVLIVDNCEHVVAMAASVVERISAELPRLCILVTSREPLRTRQEQVFFLPGLCYPENAASITAEEVLQYPAIQLFVSRSGKLGAAGLTDECAREIASVCARLEGLALAIELAAGTASALDRGALRSFFGSGFGSLNRGPRDAPLRHQTLEATLDWSYRLLPEREAVLLELLSLFSGSFCADDVEPLYTAGGLDPMVGRDALSQLAAKSLVTSRFAQGRLRYRLPESTSAYASRRLASASYWQVARQHFAVSVRTKLQNAEREWSLQSSRQWLERYRGLIDDVRSVIAWAFDPSGDPELGAAIVVAALPLWQELSAFKEMLAAIELAETSGSPRPGLSAIDRVKMSTARAWAMMLARRMHPRCGAAWARSVEEARAVGNVEFELPAVCGRAVYLAYSGRPVTAVRSLHRYAAETGLDWDAVPDAKRFLAHAEMYAGRLSSAAARLDALAKEWSNLADGRRLSRFQVDLPVAIGLSQAFVLWLQGSPRQASEVAERAVARASELDHMISLGNALCLAALPIAFLSGDRETASRFTQRLGEVGRYENIGIYEGTSTFFAGAIRVAAGDETGLAIMDTSIARLEADGWVTRVAFYRCMLAECWLDAGEIRRAQDCLDAALAQPHLREERWCHADLLRVAGLVARSKRAVPQARHLLGKSRRWALAMGAGAAAQRAGKALAHDG